MVLELLHIVFISISYESRSSVASQPCQRMDASLKPAEALGSTKVQEISNVSQKLYSCDLCHKKYALVMRFNRHKNDHKTGKAVVQKKDEIQRANKGWQCNLCGKTGSNYSSLKRHKSQVHEGPPKSCKNCGTAIIIIVGDI